MLQECLRHLGMAGDKRAYYAWVSERTAAIDVLRRLCETHGDNEWPDDLHLGDILEKHLERRLEHDA